MDIEQQKEFVKGLWEAYRLLEQQQDLLKADGVDMVNVRVAHTALYKLITHYTDGHAPWSWQAKLEQEADDAS